MVISPIGQSAFGSIEAVLLGILYTTVSSCSGLNIVVFTKVFSQTLVLFVVGTVCI